MSRLPEPGEVYYGRRPTIETVLRRVEAELAAGGAPWIRVRDANGMLGTVVALERRMVAVQYDAPALRRFGAVLLPLGSLTFLSESATDPTPVPR